MITRSLSLYRATARAWLSEYGAGRIDSPQALVVCQGRQFAHGYSGCADLAHSLWFDGLGLRHDRINRDSPEYGVTWKVGQNVSLLAGWSEAGRKPVDPIAFDAGDVCVQWLQGGDEHVFVVVDNLGGGRALIAEYGQAAPQIGHLVERDLLATRRPIKRWLPLDAVLKACGVELADA